LRNASYFLFQLTEAWKRITQTYFFRQGNNGFIPSFVILRGRKESGILSSVRFQGYSALVSPATAHKSQLCHEVMPLSVVEPLNHEFW